MRVKFGMAARMAMLLFLAAAAGCSTVDSIQRFRDARHLSAQAALEAKEGNYTKGLEAYLKARRQLLASRALGLGYFANEREVEEVDRSIEQLDKSAVDNGLVRFDDRYVEPDEVGKELTDALTHLFREATISSIAQERIVPETFAAAVSSKGENSFDITLSMVVKDVGEDADFRQDVWGAVRFLMEGGYGNGFSYCLKKRFAGRAWMGSEGEWGISNVENHENHFIGLKGRISRFAIQVQRGHYRQRREARAAPSGFIALDAVGPYWYGEPFRTYVLEGNDAARLNWLRASQIPDAALYGMMKITRGGKPPVASGAEQREAPKLNRRFQKPMTGAGPRA